MPASLRILLVESDPERAERVREALAEAGESDVVVFSGRRVLARDVAETMPDIVLVDIAHPSRDVLEELAQATRPMDRPVAMFVDRSDPATTRAAIEAGVSAYVVDGLRADRIRPILDAAVARFHLFQRVRSELAATKAALEERKVIDRAKGLVMKARGVSEEEAYALIRKTAMDQGKRVADVAQALVTAADLLR
ncbi:MAG: ANTAR domain-containing protein [Phreatobacter sp.]|nr:ANTAR domain-containing protein [Phreatobacter sp.]